MRIALAIALCVLIIIAIVGIVGRRSSHGTDAQIRERAPLVAVESGATTPPEAPAETVAASPASTPAPAVASAAPKARRGVYDPRVKRPAASAKTDWMCVPGTSVGLWPKSTG
jgi:hypothetical protein